MYYSAIVVRDVMGCGGGRGTSRDKWDARQLDIPGQCWPLDSGTSRDNVGRSTRERLTGRGVARDSEKEGSCHRLCCLTRVEADVWPMSQENDC